MNTYEITFRIQTHRYVETVEATSTFDARRLILQRYPGCSIWNVRRL